MKSYILIFSILSVVFFTQCKKVLDKNDLGAVNEKGIWEDTKLATAYVNKIYADNLPSWDTEIAGNSDESPGGGGIMYGQLTINSIDHWPYFNIRNINILLANIDKGTLSQETKDLLKGQAYFFRALRYFEMVRLYGGVPLILEPESLTDDLLVERSSTSACIDQIVSDLDQATALLVDKWTGNDVGRITKGASMALKGRVLLYWASPQFNPTNERSRWELALKVNQDAKNYLTEHGHGLYENFKDIWFDELNKEVVFVTRFQEPGKVHNWDAATRPISEAQNATGANQPTWEFVQSFPMKDGRSISVSDDYDPTYFWLNRDPRFDATIAYNGSLWELSGKTGRKQWSYVGAEPQFPTQTGFYCRKAINTSYTPYLTERSSTDWVEIRFAEVLFNYAEAAAQTGDLAASYAVLKEIRKRAGIEPGIDGLYGLEANMNQLKMVEALLFERKIEFAFEGKRYWDLRRTRAFESALNTTKRHGLLILGNLSTADLFEVRDKINIDHEYDKFFRDSIVVVDRVFPIQFKPEYYFYAIPQKHLELNSKLKQTLGWDDGSFDPLK